MSSDGRQDPLDAADGHPKVEKAIERIVSPRLEDLGGFSVKRLLPNAERRMVGPWIFFDHFGPVDFAPGPGIDVRPHPHINLATVTYLFAGEIVHRDSLGSLQPIRPGDINLMVAGKGIVHSERESTAARASERRLHGLQLWLALPLAEEESDPAFMHYGGDDLPTTAVDGVAIRVMIGSGFGLTSPVKTFGQTLYAEADVPAGRTIVLPQDVEELAVYVVSGALRTPGDQLPEYTMALCRPEHRITLAAETDARLAIIGGANPGMRHIWWNFVSSRCERIEQAKRDWEQGRFAKIPGDEEEFIPLPRSDR
jgi:redox-sensitive bicupin YhaK (pirin superfamily)